MTISWLERRLRGPFSFPPRFVHFSIVLMVVAIAVLFVVSPKLLHELLSTKYMPHIYCYLGNAPLAWTQVIADGLVGLAYFAISGTLVYLIYRGGKDLPFHWIFLAFGLFIVACGTSHLIGALTVWKPFYVLEAAVLVLTALASVATATLLPFTVPRVISLIQEARASEARRLLVEQTLRERDTAQLALKQSNAELEQRVLERTEQIAKVNEALEADNSERRKSEERFRQSEERFRKAFHGSPLPMTISTESAGRFLDANDAFLALVKLERPAVVGRTVSDLGYWVDSQARLTVLQRLHESGKVIDFSAQLLDSAGEKHEASVSAEMIELEGQPCVLTITRDTTETKRLQQQFQQAQKMEAIGLLAGGVAHDFNNLLGVILGNSQLLEESSAFTTAQMKRIHEIEKAAQRATAVTRQLLAFSRRQVLETRVLDLNALITDVTKLLRRLIGEDVQLTLRLEPAAGHIKADPGQLEQVVMNLAVNARDAMPRGGQLVIETTNLDLTDDQPVGLPQVAPGSYVLLSVSDTGCGMDAETQSRIFEPFFTTKELGKGTGLGLSMVYGVIKQSGGYIQVNTELGVGTTFKIYLPRMNERLAAVDPQPSDVEIPRGTETIILVEDEEALRFLTTEILEAAGYKILEAQNGLHAVELARQYGEQIHLLLTDVVMPGMNGRELADSLGVSRPGIKVLYVSGYTDELVAQHGLLSPGMELLHKPFTKDALLRRVRVVLDGRV